MGNRSSEHSSGGGTDRLGFRERATIVSWRDLLDKGDEKVTLPWLGGRALHAQTRSWEISGQLPREHGWYTFQLKGRTASNPVPGEAQPVLNHVVLGYLVGDRIVPDGVRVEPNPGDIVKRSERIFLVDEGVDRFARVTAGRVYELGPLVFQGLAMPLGPEDEVMSAFLDQKDSVADVKGVHPSLDAAFRMEVWWRKEAERRRKELEEQRRKEEEERAKAERRQQLAEQLGTGEGRRAMAHIDFDSAARAALAVSGAELLDVKKVERRGEYVVRYRFEGRRLECTCDREMRIIDSGICLVDHDSGEKGDDYFTLESLPSVIRQAVREGLLVVRRHV